MDSGGQHGGGDRLEDVDDSGGRVERKMRTVVGQEDSGVQWKSARERGGGEGGTLLAIVVQRRWGSSGSAVVAVYLFFSI